MSNEKLGGWVRQIISGGQTGVDRAALDSAIMAGLPIGGWCPKGRLSEDGIVPLRYPLKEHASPDYDARTRENVLDSDGTLVLTFGMPTGGTADTIRLARFHERPYRVVDLESKPSVEETAAWLASRSIGTLNVAGPRASHREDVYDAALSFLLALWKRTPA